MGKKGSRSKTASKNRYTCFEKTLLFIVYNLAEEFIIDKHVANSTQNSCQRTISFPFNFIRDVIL